VIRLDRLPRPGETIVVRGAAGDLGGKGANQAVVLGRCRQDVRLVAAIGADAVGERIRANLVAERVRTDGLGTIAGLVATSNSLTPTSSSRPATLPISTTSGPSNPRPHCLLWSAAGSYPTTLATSSPSSMAHRRQRCRSKAAGGTRSIRSAPSASSTGRAAARHDPTPWTDTPICKAT
jgi:sugar/nucleoside kinase (ribokinase family)